VLEGWSLRLAAEHLGVTPPTVKRAQLRGLEGLRKAFVACKSQIEHHTDSGEEPSPETRRALSLA
jgi:DNA-directed RNA polymerase specialized sigma24 family protein